MVDLDKLKEELKTKRTGKGISLGLKIDKRRKTVITEEKEKCYNRLNRKKKKIEFNYMADVNNGLKVQDLISKFYYDKLKVTEPVQLKDGSYSTNVQKIFSNRNKKKLAIALVFNLLDIMFDDLIENGGKFMFADNLGQISIHKKSKQATIKYLRRTKNKYNVEYLFNNFSYYAPYLFLKVFKNKVPYIRKFDMFISESKYRKLIDNVNKGKRYFGEYLYNDYKDEKEIIKQRNYERRGKLRAIKEKKDMESNSTKD